MAPRLLVFAGMSRKRSRKSNHPTKRSQSSEAAESSKARAPQRGNATFDPDERKVEDRMQRPRRDDDDVLERAERVSRVGPNSEMEEAEVAEEDILEEIDVGELRYG